MSLFLLLATIILGPCPTEDSTACAWDASSQGNHIGQSFVALSGRTIYP